MKKLVGQREKVDPEMKTALAILSLFSFHGPPPTKIQFHESCAECKAPIIINLTEDTNTGEIWVEGPDECANCAHTIASPDAQYEMLSQEAIAGFFGKY